MARNRKFDTTDTLSLEVGTGVESGDPVVFGAGLTGVALTDADDNDAASVQIRPGSVFTLEVVAATVLGSPVTGSAVTAGDLLYRAASGVISKTATGVLIGVALGVYNDQDGYYPTGQVIASADTDEIDVLLR